MKDGRKITLLSSIVFFILGMIIFVKPEMVVKVISYVIGGGLILVGVYSTISYIVNDRRLKVVNYNEIMFGITAIILGLLFILLAGAIELLLRIVVGVWVIMSGISRIYTSMIYPVKDARFYSLIIVGIILIGLGFYIVFYSNLAISIIGLFMMLYGLIDFISYFVYKNASLEVNKKINSKEDIKEAEIVKDSEE